LQWTLRGPPLARGALPRDSRSISSC
jgi:hypothetical protein